MRLVQDIIDTINIKYGNDIEEGGEQPGFFSGLRNEEVNSAEEFLQVVMICAESLEDSQEICDQLIMGNVVIINMERTERGQQSRIIDFISGVIYAQNGSLLPISSNIYISAPEEIELSGRD